MGCFKGGHQLNWLKKKKKQLKSSSRGGLLFTGEISLVAIITLFNIWSNLRASAISGARNTVAVQPGTCDADARPPHSGWLALWIIHGLRVLEINKMNDNKKLIKNFLNCCQVSLMGNSLGWLHPWKPAGCWGWRWLSERSSNSMWPGKQLGGGGRLPVPLQRPSAAHPSNFSLQGEEALFQTRVSGSHFSARRGPRYPPPPVRASYFPLQQPPTRGSQSHQMRDSCVYERSGHYVLASTRQSRGPWSPGF